MKTALSDNPEHIEVSKEIGQRLNAIRKSKKLSQIEVAKALNITQSSLSQLERGQRVWSCPSIIKLIKFYKVPYEAVFGEIPIDNEPVFKPEDYSASPAALLEKLADTVKSDEISTSVKAYVYISVYRMFRQLYESNPRNSSAIFKIESDFADHFTQDFIKEEPFRISSFIKASGKVNKNTVELPVEYSAELRNMISKCEKFILMCSPDCE